LVLGYDPANQRSYQIEDHKREEIPDGYGALKAALVNAVRSGKLDAKTTLMTDDYNNQPYDRIDIDETIISVQSLTIFLKEKGFSEGFFFPQGNIFEAYLDSKNPFFASKLSAAINAWKAVTENQKSLAGKTPKQALEKWLRENASKYGLTKDDGTPNETGIQEICKISNWKPEGGAAKTPMQGIVQDNSPTPFKNVRKLRVFGEKTPEVSWDEEEIPF
jgi:hypothetical protein